VLLWEARHRRFRLFNGFGFDGGVFKHRFNHNIGLS
jgi:hypothetical protein